MRRGRRGVPLEALLFLAAGVLLAAGNTRDLLAPAPYEPTPRREGELRVVTWNLGEGVEEGGAPLRMENLDAVSRSLVALEPDLVVLQEITGGRQLSALRERLGPGWEGRLALGGGRRVALLARTDDLDLLSFEPLEGSESRLLGATFRDVRGREVVVGAVHASAFSAERRNVEVGRAVDLLSEAARERPGALAVLAGDLNLDLDLDKRRDLFTDDSHLDVETYNYAANAFTDAARGRGFTAEPDRRLDYVFLGPGFEARAGGPWRGQRVGDMDHDPVVVDVRRSEPD